MPEISIKVVGDWNTKIFTPDWVGNFLLKNNIETEKNENQVTDENEILEIEFSQNLDLTFSYKKIKILPTDKYVQINLADTSLETQKLALQIAANLLLTLPHTPKLAIGFNYTYLINEKAPDFEFKTPVGFRVATVRLFKEENNFFLNNIFEFGSNATVTIYNFHYKKPLIIKDDLIESHLKYINELNIDFQNGNK